MNPDLRTITHDLRGPLLGLLGFTELLLRDSAKLTPRQRGYLEKIQLCGQELKSKVDRLSAAGS
ncbi:MAG: hypothetical protein FJW39_05265 [Acidobacteria bacterium]|nr:hypothetical protein [Acidobacteriota bacterium]